LVFLCSGWVLPAFRKRAALEIVSGRSGKADLKKHPSIAEILDWACLFVVLSVDALTEENTEEDIVSWRIPYFKGEGLKMENQRATMSDAEEITIRPANSSDTRAISAILREPGWFAHVNTELPAATEERISQRLELCSAEERHLVLVAENQYRKVIGYVAVHWLPYLFLAGPEGYVSELFIRESERGKGVGRRLLEAVKNQAVKRGCTRLMLVNGRNRPSYERSFYKKLGWQERPEVANFVLPLLF
jgi:GNAT superfamily N-acetyltransferase